MRRNPDTDPVTQPVIVTPLRPMATPIEKPLTGKALLQRMNEEVAKLEAQTREKTIPPVRRLTRSSTAVQE